VASRLLSELRLALRARPHAKRATSAAAYMKVALPFLGLPIPDVRRIARTCFRTHTLADARAFQSLLKEGFLEATYQEERYAVLAIAAERRCRVFQTAAVLPLYRRLIIAGGWWDVVDELACRVGDALLAEPAKVAPRLRAWARSRELWLRRAAIVCQRKARAKTDIDLLFACIDPSLGEKDFFLRKGIGWALRALAYHAPDEVRRYVRLHADELSPLSQREALRRLAPENAARPLARSLP